MNVGDRFTEEVAEILIESFREDGITVDVEEVKSVAR
jgi:menaquinone-dependent protoporphyrinogen IX oxidase